MAKGSKRPKRIAGMKLPKRLRAPAGAIGRLTRNRIVGDLISAAIIAAAGAIVRSDAARRLAQGARRRVQRLI